MPSLFTVATPEELLDLFGCAENIAAARERGLTPDRENADLAAIYHWRGEKALSKAHIAKIVDVSARLTTTVALNEIIQ